MKVKLIQITQDPIDVMYVSARTCYSENSPIEMWEEIEKFYISPDNVNLDNYKQISDKHWNLVKKVLNSGHQSVAEHVYFTFAIEGISRICSHQLVRHRHCTFSQQSQRYVRIKEDVSTLLKLIKNFEHGGETKEQEDSMIQELLNICSKYFNNVTRDNFLRYAYCLLWYSMNINDGNKPEDARNILPNCTKTNITFSCNYRELIHICNLRLCTRAQKEIRDLFRLIKEEVNKVEPRLAEYLVPNCEVNGFCTEHQSCGRKPQIKDILSKYNDEYTDGI